MTEQARETADDREPQTEALTAIPLGIMQLFELLPNPRQILGGDARSGVAHLNPHQAADGDTID